MMARKVPDLVRTALTEPLVQCDAFTAEAGAGNAAAVVFSQRKGDAQWMQKERTTNDYYIMGSSYLGPVINTLTYMSRHVLCFG